MYICGVAIEKHTLMAEVNNCFGIQSCHLLCKCIILPKIVSSGSAVYMLFDWLLRKLHHCLHHSKPTATRDNLYCLPLKQEKLHK